MEGARSLYDNMLDVLKMEKLSIRINNLEEIHVMSIITIISFIIFILLAIFWLISVLKYKF